MANASNRKASGKRQTRGTRSKAKPKRPASRSSRQRSARSKGSATKSGRQARRTSQKHPLSRSGRARTSSRARRSTASIGKNDPITLLKSDHDRMRKLMSDLESSRSADRQSSLLATIEEELKKHTQLEEDYFYPCFHEHARNKEDRTMYHEALEEHHAVDVILPELKSAIPGTPQFEARAKVLKELVEHHAKEEEKEMFPRARTIISREAMRDLGERIMSSKGLAGGGVVSKMASFIGMA